MQNDGRPKNGMFISVPDSIKENVVDVSPEFWRIQAIIIKTKTSSLLVISSYFPQDPKTFQFDDTELVETLSAISSVLENNQFSDVIWAGDINVSFVRKSGHVSAVSKYISELGLCTAWETYDVDFTHACELNGITHVSTIDHFFWNTDLSEHISDCGVLHLPENLSDHCPIYCVVDIKGIQSTQSDQLPPKNKPSWKKASKENRINFHNILLDKLNNLEIPDCVSKCNLQCPL